MGDVRVGDGSARAWGRSARLLRASRGDVRGARKARRVCQEVAAREIQGGRVEARGRGPRGARGPGLETAPGLMRRDARARAARARRRGEPPDASGPRGPGSEAPTGRGGREAEGRPRLQETIRRNVWRRNVLAPRGSARLEAGAGAGGPADARGSRGAPVHERRAVRLRHGAATARDVSPGRGFIHVVSAASPAHGISHVVDRGGAALGISHVVDPRRPVRGISHVVGRDPSTEFPTSSAAASPRPVHTEFTT